MIKGLLVAVTFVATLMQVTFFGRFRFPNYATAAVASCASDGKGYAYFDTTTGVPMICDGTTYNTFGVALSAANTWTGLNVFDRAAAGNDACFGGSSAPTICIDGDSYTITIDGATADATIVGSSTGQLTITSGAAFNLVWPGTNSLTFVQGTAGTSASLADLEVNIPIANGSDTYNALLLNLTNANQTGTSNFINGLRVDTGTADADAVESGVSIASNGDYGLRLEDATASTQTHIGWYDTAQRG